MNHNELLPWHRPVFADLWARRDRLPHALLIHGKRGIGKARLASTVAQAVLCEAPTTTGACGSCSACSWFSSGSHPDARHVEPVNREQVEEEGGSAKKSMQIVVDQVRALSDFLNMSTHRGGWRPVVIQPAEALNASAANALLKNLEEPPPHTLFILVSHALHQVLPTIKSRCRLLPVPAPTRAEATDWLHGQGIDHAELAAAHTGDAPLLAVDLPVEDYWEQRRRFLKYLAAPRLDPLAGAEECQETGIPLALEWLQKWTYDVAARNLTGALKYNVDQADAVTRTAANCDPARVLRLHRELLRMQRHAHHPLNARLALEQLFMSYADAVTARPAVQ
jgi:DNA polymerase III subunit delta'